MSANEAIDQRRELLPGLDPMEVDGLGDFGAEPHGTLDPLAQGGLRSSPRLADARHDCVLSGVSVVLSYGVCLTEGTL